MTLSSELTQVLVVAIPAISGVLLLVVKQVIKILDTRAIKREKEASKLMELEIAMYKNEIKKQGDAKNQSFAIIMGLMWQALDVLKCDRIYIIQPHPTSEYPNMPYVTITLEVKREEIAPMSPNIQNKKISEIPSFVQKLASDEFFIYGDIANTQIDKNAKTIMHLSGTKSMAVHRLKSQEKHWIGNIVAEHTSSKCWEFGICRAQLTSIAKKIQVILPDYEGIIPL